MEIIIISILAYLFIGSQDVVMGLNEDAINKPGWARNPTITMMLAVTLLWPINAIMLDYALTRQLTRSIVIGVINFITRMVGTMAFMWIAYTLSTKTSEEQYVQFITLLPIYFIGQFAIFPIIVWLIMPINLILLSIVDFVLPKK